MGTKTQTQQSVNFDPTSLGQYQQFWQMASPILNSMATNPFGSSSYQLNLAQATQAAQQQGSQAMQNALANLNTAGMGQTNSGLRAGLMAQMGRFGSGLNYQGFLGAANQAQANQWNALGIQASRSPLQTGQTSTQQTSGLGTWLPQLAGAAIGGVTSAFTGGLSNLAKVGSLPTTGFNAGGLNALFGQGGVSGANAAGNVGGMSYFNPSNYQGSLISSPATLSNPLSSYFPQANMGY